MKVIPKKYLGQHFLKDETVVAKTICSIDFEASDFMVEVGPGMGVLTEKLIHHSKKLVLIEIDKESVDYLYNNFPKDSFDLLNQDFLKLDLSIFQSKKIAIVGNFPYNISSQIVFKIWEQINLVNQMVGMFQKEVARRICAKHGNKEYGILSVLMQYDYQIDYLFEVGPASFYPPPKVDSAVIRMKRKENQPSINRELFKKLVKTSFGQRRKKLRNVLQNFTFVPNPMMDKFFNLRAEQLSVEDFVTLYHQLEDGRNCNQPI